MREMLALLLIVGGIALIVWVGSQLLSTVDIIYAICGEYGRFCK